MRPNLIPDIRPRPLWQSALLAKTLRTVGTDAAIEPMGGAGQALIITRSLGPFGLVRFTSRGPVWDEDADNAAQIAALRDSGLRIINAENTAPYVLRAAGFRRLFGPRDIAYLDVLEDEAAQLRQSHPKWRNAYRSGKRSGALTTIHRRFMLAKDSWIFTEDRAAQKKKGYRALPAALVQVMAKAEPDAVRVSIAMINETPVAAMMFLHHHASATYHIGWTNADGRRANAHQVLLIEATQKLRRLGVTQIDLGLYTPKDAPGLAQFKRRSGAVVQTLGGTWIKIPFL